MVGLSIAAAAAVTAARISAGSPARLRAEAERASREGAWSEALQSWRAFNATAAARGSTHRAEAAAALKLGCAAQAERGLRRASAADPADPETWRLLLEVLRVEGRTIEAAAVGRAASSAVPAGARRQVLRERTLALLVELPEETVRATLRRWIDADPADVDARVALLRRIADAPRGDDPDRGSRLAELESMLAEHPDHPGVREAAAAALADAGEPDRGRRVLDAWPDPDADPRYLRLRGRWDLEYDHRPAEAAEALRAVVEAVPQDWRSWYRLARALRQIGRDADARRAAAAVERIREALDPATLGPRLDDDLRHLDDPRALRDLAALCDQAGLADLARAWRAEAGD